MTTQPPIDLEALARETYDNLEEPICPKAINIILTALKQVAAEKDREIEELKNLSTISEIKTFAGSFEEAARLVTTYPFIRLAFLDEKDGLFKTFTPEEIFGNREKFEQRITQLTAALLKVDSMIVEWKQYARHTERCVTDQKFCQLNGLPVRCTCGLQQLLNNDAKEEQ